jgi:GNAT superfamily N-acetyltransferase
MCLDITIKSSTRSRLCCVDLAHLYRGHMLPPSEAAFEIRDLTSASLSSVLDLARQEKWQHQYRDLKFLLSLSEGIGVYSGPNLIGSGFFTPFGPEKAMLNTIIVSRHARGMGIGSTLVNRLLEKAQSRECNLVATPSGLSLYKRWGFAELGTVFHLEGVMKPFTSPQAPEYATLTDHGRIAKFDRSATFMDRTALLQRFFRDARVVTARQGSDIQGYASLREFGDGYIIGPVIAQSDTTAWSLVSDCLCLSVGRRVRVDITTKGTALLPRLVELGFRTLSKGVAMTNAETNPIFNSSNPSVYMLASQALG